MFAAAQTAAPRRSRLSLIRDVLTLRAWAIRELLSSESSKPSARSPDVAVDAWEFFLRTECCAIPLAARLDLTHGADPFPPAIVAAISAHAASEWQRVLAARAQLAEIAATASTLPARIVVLKGGAEVFSATPLDVGDIDLLVDATDLDTVAAALGMSGAVHPSERHLPRIALARGLPIELHVRVGAETGLDPVDVSRATPAPGIPGLFALPNLDHAWHVLIHCTITHPHRRGHVRDLLMIRRTVARLSPAERAAFDARIASIANRATRAVLECTVAAATQGAVTDPFTRMAVVKYVVIGRSRPMLQRVLPGFVSVAPLAAAGWPLLAPAARAVLFESVRRGSHWYVAGVLDRWPRAEPVFRAIRFPYRLLLLAVGASLALYATAIWALIGWRSDAAANRS